MTPVPDPRTADALTPASEKLLADFDRFPDAIDHSELSARLWLIEREVRRAALAAEPVPAPLDVADLRARIETNLRVYQHRVDAGTATDFDCGKRAGFRVVLAMLDGPGKATFSCARPATPPEPKP